MPFAADGSFFGTKPMREFGASAVGYACYFGAIDTVRKLLSHPRTAAIVDLNSDDLRCARSGYLPVHAAVAAGPRVVPVVRFPLGGARRPTSAMIGCGEGGFALAPRSPAYGMPIPGDAGAGAPLRP